MCTQFAGSSGAQRSEARVADSSLPGIPARYSHNPAAAAASAPTATSANCHLCRPTSAFAPYTPAGTRSPIRTCTATAVSGCIIGYVTARCGDGDGYGSRRRAGAAGRRSRAAGWRGSVRGLWVLRAVWVLRGRGGRGPVRGTLRRGLRAALRPIYGLQRRGGRLRSVRR